MRINPQQKDGPRKAHAAAQYTELMSIEQFADHIATHGCVYSSADIYAILKLAVTCMREQLLAGQRIQLADMGVFGIHLKSKGTGTIAEFTESNITDVRVSWRPGKQFRNLKDDAVFALVPTRKAAAKVTKAIRAGETNVDLSETKPSPGE